MQQNPLSFYSFQQKKQRGKGKGRSFVHDFAHGIFKVLPAITAMSSLLKKVIQSDTIDNAINKAVDYLKSKESDRQYIQEDLDVARKGDFTWEELLTFQEAGYDLNYETWKQLQEEMSPEVRKSIDDKRLEKRDTFERKFMMDNITYPEASAKLNSSDPNYAQNLRTLINNRSIFNTEKLYDMTPEDRKTYKIFYNKEAPIRPSGQAPVNLDKLRNDTATLYSSSPNKIVQPTEAEAASIRARLAAKRAPLIKK